MRVNVKNEVYTTPKGSPLWQRVHSHIMHCIRQLMGTLK